MGSTRYKDGGVYSFPNRFSTDNEWLERFLQHKTRKSIKDNQKDNLDKLYIDMQQWYELRLNLTELRHFISARDAVPLRITYQARLY